MYSDVKTILRYGEGCIIKETTVDGDVFEIVEQYFDDEGYLIYERVIDYSPEKLMKMHGKKKHTNKKLEKNRRRK